MRQTPSLMPPTRIGYLDTWRCIAVAAVILAHLPKSIADRVLSSPVHLLFEYGQVGVFIFFFISGHVVSKTCLRELSSTGTFSIGAFYTRRVFRIVPPLLIYLAVCVTLFWSRLIDARSFEFLTASLYLCNIAPAGCGWYTGHTWSLAFEEQFYLLFPLLFL